MLDWPGVTVSYSVDHKSAISTGIHNLFSNFANRSPNSVRGPFYDSTYIEAIYRSCYRAECVACGDTKFSMNVSFSAQVHINAILFVLDTHKFDPFDGLNVPQTVHSFDIYMIAEDLSETHCGTYDTSVNYGFEAWCNLEAKSFRIEGSPADPTNWDITICSLGAFGSIYEHQSPLTTSVAIK